MNDKAPGINEAILYPWTTTRGGKLPSSPVGWPEVQFTHMCRSKESAERYAKWEKAWFYDDFTPKAVPIPSTGRR